MKFSINPFTKRLDAFEQDQPGSSDIETLTGNSGGLIHPNATANISILGGVGVNVVGDPLTHTLTITDDDLVQGNITTSDDTPTTCISFPMGAIPGTYILSGRLAAFNATDVAGAGYWFSGAYRTTGAAGTEINTQIGNEFEEAAMATADWDLLCTGNNIIVQVTGILAKDIDWAAEFEYHFVG